MGRSNVWHCDHRLVAILQELLQQWRARRAARLHWLVINLRARPGDLTTEMDSAPAYMVTSGHPIIRDPFRLAVSFGRGIYALLLEPLDHRATRPSSTLACGPAGISFIPSLDEDSLESVSLKSVSLASQKQKT